MRHVRYDPDKIKYPDSWLARAEELEKLWKLRWTKPMNR